MKKVLLFIAAAALLIAVTLFFSEGWIYLVTALAAITIVILIRHFHSPLLKLTRWAKKNPRKTQVLITVLQIIILSTGLVIGYNLNKLGYQFSEIPIFIFSTVLCLGFFSTPFLPKKNTIALPVTVMKDRIAYMTTVLSAFMVMLVTGNRIEKKYPNSFISHALTSIDESMFSENHFSDEEVPVEFTSNSILFHGNGFASIAVNMDESTIHPSEEDPAKLKADKKAKRFEKKFEKKKQKIMKRIEPLRKAFAAGASAGVIFLVILLIGVCCAGICIALSGNGAGSVFLGLIILGLAVFGIVKLLNKKRTKSPKQET